MKAFPERPEMSPRVFARKALPPVPVPPPSQHRCPASLAGPGGEARGPGGSLGESDALPPRTRTCRCPVPCARCRRALVSPPDPRPAEIRSLEHCPFPGRARTCHGWLLAPGAPAIRGHESFTAFGFVQGWGRGRGRCTCIDLFLRLVRVCALSLSWAVNPLVEGSAGGAGRGFPGDGGGVRVTGVGATQRGSASSQSLGPVPTPGAANNRTAGVGGGDDHPATGFRVSRCPS